MPDMDLPFRLVDQAALLNAVAAEHQVPNPLLRQLYRFWDDLRGRDAMPAYSQLDPLDIPRTILPHVFLNDVLAPNRFRVRLQGTEAVRQSGVDLTGRIVDEIDGAEGTQQRFETIVTTRSPYYCRVPLTWSPLDYKTYEAIVLPLADPDGVDVRRIFGASIFS